MWKNKQTMKKTDLGLGLPPDATDKTDPKRGGGDFAETILEIMELPLKAGEKAAAIRQMLAERAEI